MPCLPHSLFDHPNVQLRAQIMKLLITLFLHSVYFIPVLTNILVSILSPKHLQYFLPLM